MILDQNDIVPELYATPWFVTCFSRTLPLNALYILWDYYLMELVTDQYPYQHYFVCLAILILNRDKIIKQLHKQTLKHLIQQLDYNDF